jgi:hypothetical protein
MSHNIFWKYNLTSIALLGCDDRAFEVYDLISSYSNFIISKI